MYVQQLAGNVLVETMIVWKKYWNLWRIKREWKGLETKRGTCVFQQFEFVESLLEHWWEYLPVGKSVPEFFVFYEDRRAVCIIPVERKISTGERCLFAGANGYDYHDFLYVNCEYLSKCLMIFTKEVGDLVISNLRDKSASSSVLNINGGSGYTCSVEIDVSKYKQLSNGYNEWLKSLSVNVRQNLRTAYNRIRTDGLKWDLLMYRGGDKYVQINDIARGGVCCCSEC